ncbi:MAG: [FeFe] hydrogenase H-cluster radical SAM maturase HydG [Planctomycetota bacterium]|nr:[FeFe] hydrogenase H-cluster radical SAM maturase HydG [Planctomycetota bacterium]MDI6788240.1 [FeFe] hydrogenase H-cluster radical SAM maturase HydG [Planctomycetota bacterium]
MKSISNIVDTDYLNELLSQTHRHPPESIHRIIEKARQKKGLTVEEVVCLVNLQDKSLLNKLFEAAALIKQEIYGERLVFFAPLYVSDYCVNDCEYCNFHIRNKTLKRRQLTLDEIAEQTAFLINQGHKRILLELGEDTNHNNIDYVVEAIKKIYSVRTPKGNIRRVNVNIASTTVENYRKLKSAGIGTYQLFQETYHHATYKKLHHGPKENYERQITAHDRAFQGGLDDVGLGVLFGLYDWRFEVLSLVSHSQYLDKTHRVGPHTISVPRICPAPTVTYQPEYPVSDDDFLKLIAILRLAVPYTGMIISTREGPEIRKLAFRIGISQASAGSVTTTGGYGTITSHPQFTIHDNRSLQDVIKDALDNNLIPSFCTACYRSGRTGERFMNLAKPGNIHKLCKPNAILTFAEYLADCTTDGLLEKGRKSIDKYLSEIEDESLQKETRARLERIKAGERDIYF